MVKLKFSNWEWAPFGTVVRELVSKLWGCGFCSHRAPFAVHCWRVSNRTKQAVQCFQPVFGFQLYQWMRTFSFNIICNCRLWTKPRVERHINVEICWGIKPFRRNKYILILAESRTITEITISQIYQTGCIIDAKSIKINIVIIVIP